MGEIYGEGKNMSGGLLLIPFFMIRFLLPSVLARGTLQRAAYFAPMTGKERIAYYIYQMSNMGMFLFLFFLKIKIDVSWQSYSGMFSYVLGLVLCAVTIVHFSSPDDHGFNRNGLYQWSRNPMYVAYFVCFIGMVLLTQSMILMGLVMIFQISAHWIILAEERWCIDQFGKDYIQYMEDVRRYF